MSATATYVATTGIWSLIKSPQFNDELLKYASGEMLLFLNEIFDRGFGVVAVDVFPSYNHCLIGFNISPLVIIAYWKTTEHKWVYRYFTEVDAKKYFICDELLTAQEYYSGFNLYNRHHDYEPYHMVHISNSEWNKYTK